MPIIARRTTNRAARRATDPEPVALRPLALAPIVVAGLVGWLGLRSGNPWLQFLACAAGAPLIVAWLVRPRLDDLSFQWRAPYRAVVGEIVEHRVEAVNIGRRPTPAATLTHSVRGFEDVTVLVPALPVGGTADVVLPRRADLRTISRRHALVVKTTAPLGLLEHRRSWVLDAAFVVHPAPAAPSSLTALGGDGDAPSAASARTGIDLHATREWRRGDDRRHVHWRSTARHGSLVVVEPERTLARRVSVVVCGDAQSPHWEALVARAAWTVVAALRTGREALLVAADGWPDADTPDLVCADATSALDWFAGLRAPRPPDGEALARAAAWAGDDGEVLLVGTREAVAVDWVVAPTRPGAAPARLVRLEPPTDAAGVMWP
jgi:uncharacterized protein (DUF58 family)